MRPPFVVVGDIMTDVVAHTSGPLRHATDTPGRIEMHGGGAGANTAAWLANAGRSVSLVGVVGDDLAGRAVVDELANTGVQVRTRIDGQRSTGTVVVIVDPTGERTMVPDPGANVSLAPQDIPDELFVPDAHLHLSGYTLLNQGSRLAGLSALDLARLRRMTTSIDPASVGPLLDIGVADALEWMSGADILLANEDEARALSGETDAVAAGAFLATRFATVVIKRGAAGAMAWKDGAGPVSSPATSLQVRDTTGAGDAFAAGFLAASTTGADIVACLARGNQFSGRCVGATGARP